jgi:hypothetical protein
MCVRLSSSMFEKAVASRTVRELPFFVFFFHLCRGSSGVPAQKKVGATANESASSLNRGKFGGSTLYR